jgi:hypothetical protein
MWTAMANRLPYYREFVERRWYGLLHDGTFQAVSFSRDQNYDSNTFTKVGKTTAVEKREIASPGLTQSLSVRAQTPSEEQARFSRLITTKDQLCSG